ncbi:unnamed protein product [Parnassius apollo]|uniref:(apollo) hypothetical protein n=1 Tax=Parnassius apollo TaxID=110799 RepID=A0A8S3YAI8_PARAO|nr:unnamed protein product [Parnassius apollo]
MIKHFSSFQMPRNWTRKTSKASWNVDNLQAAAVRIRKGVSMRKVAEETEAITSTSGRNVIGPQPSTSDDITNYKPNDSINQENNKSNSEPLAGLVSQLTLLPCIGKGKGKGKRTQQSEILTATPLKTVFKEKDKTRKKKEKHTGGKAIKKIKEVKKKLFKSSSSEESADEQVLYESGDSDLENIEIPLNIQKNTQIERDQSVCTICLEEGKSREIWYRCRLCAGWAQEACTVCDDPSRYSSDFCIN